MADLMPEQKAKLDKQASFFIKNACYVVAASWLMFVAAVWYGSWKLAGIGALFLIPAGANLFVVAALRSEYARTRIAERVNQNRT